MFKHVVVWQVREDLSREEEIRIKQEIKEQIEALNGRIPGLIDVRVYIDELPTSNAKVLLDSSFPDAEAAAVYNDHPEHVAIKENLIMPNLTNRLCMDYIVP